MKNEYKLNVPWLNDKPEILADLQGDIDSLLQRNKVSAAMKRKDEIEKFYSRKKS